jgi:2-iminobutanoate/2-iminopropanoate deaminase
MKRKRLVYLASIAIAAGSIMALSQTRKIIAPPGSSIPGLPFSPGVSSGDLLHVAGLLGTDDKGNVIAGGIEAQTKKALENVGAVLKAGGMDYKDVVAVNVYLADMRDFDAMNKIYRETFATNPPVRATTQADLMLRDGLVEIAAIAARPQLPRRYIQPQGWSANPLPYSKAIAVGDYVFVSGLVSQNPQTGAVVAGDPKVQTKQILDNAKVLVETAGFKMTDLVWSRVWLSDPRDFQAMNEVYRGYFGDIPPTRATTRAGLTSPAYKVEIMLWGVKGEKQRLGNAPAAGGTPLSQAIKAGNYVFVSGLTGAGAELRGNMKGQAGAIMTNLQNLLKAGGVDFPKVVEAQVWITDARNFAAMNEAYTAAIKADFPARVTVGAQLMNADNLVEMAMIAVKQ